MHIWLMWSNSFYIMRVRAPLDSFICVLRLDKRLQKASSFWNKLRSSSSCAQTHTNRICVLNFDLCEFILIFFLKNAHNVSNMTQWIEKKECSTTAAFYFPLWSCSLKLLLCKHYKHWTDVWFAQNALNSHKTNIGCRMCWLCCKRSRTTEKMKERER